MFLISNKLNLSFLRCKNLGLDFSAITDKLEDYILFIQVNNTCHLSILKKLGIHALGFLRCE